MRKYIFVVLFALLAVVGNAETVWSGNGVNPEGEGWGVRAQIPGSAFANAQVGQVMRFKVKDLSSNPVIMLYYVAPSDSWDALPDASSEHLSGTYQDFTITATILNILQTTSYLIVSGQGYTLTEIELLGTEPSNPHTITADTVWTGNAVCPSSWSVCTQIPASNFANAQVGQLMRFKVKDLGAHPVIALYHDWDAMPGTSTGNITGNYHDFTITSEMLTALQSATYLTISGESFTLTEVLLIDPASLRPLTLSVPVTNNWVFNGKPSITIHAVNPYSETIEANAEVRIATDKASPVTTITKTVNIAAGASADITLTTENNLDPGFYRATCSVNDDPARDAFIFGINPTEIVSAPDMQPDFHTYWAEAKQQLAAINMNATLTEITSHSSSQRKVYLVEMNSIPDGKSGTPVVIRGYYCEPQDGKQHPVLLHFAGYDSNYRPAGQDYKPWCPYGNDNPDYAEFLLSTRGQNINNRNANERVTDGKGDFVNIYGDWFAYQFGNKDSYYYRGAFMDCVQAVRFMATRPTSDMSRLYGEGMSQGGAFTYAAAALSDIPFTAIAPAVTFLGDYPDYFELVTWPGNVARENKGSMTSEQMYTFLSYFDTKNLATRIYSPTITNISLQDGTCPPHTNIAPYNNLQTTDKQVTYNPELNHECPSSWSSTYKAFFNAHTVPPTIPHGLGTDDISSSPSNVNKYIKDGHLYIICDGKTYNAQGLEVK